MKGNNWVEKWDMVKKQNGYQEEDNLIGVHGPPLVCKPTPRNVLNRVPRRADLHTEDTEVSSTLGSSETQTSAPSEELSFQHRFVQPISRSQLGRTKLSDSQKGLDDPKDYSLHSGPERYTPLRTARGGGTHWDVGTSDGTDDPPYTALPTYHTSTRNSRYLIPVSPSMHSKTILDTPSKIVSSATARKVVAMARERKGSVVNEEDAWKKIKMQRDEKDADDFRSDRILERCWEVWKQGFVWIATTNQQINEARDNLLLRLSLQRWRTLMISRNEMYNQITGLSNNGCLKRFLTTWRDRLREKQQLKWRHTMRLKIKTIKEKRDLILQKGAWTNWRQSYRSKLSQQHYEDALRIRTYSYWKARLSAFDALDAVADDVLRTADDRRVMYCWERWRKTYNMEGSAQMMLEKTNRRKVISVIGIWKSHTRARNLAKNFYHLFLMRRMVQRWITSQDKIRLMENRATKHIARQDGVLLRAVSRVWKARERGKLLERVRIKRLLKGVWGVWRQHIRHQNDKEKLAVSFSLRSNSNTLVSTFRRWHETFNTHQNALSFAKDYHSAQLRYIMLLSWRLKLRDKLNIIKMARRADSYFAARRAYRMWCSTFESRTREKAFNTLEQRYTIKIFLKWIHRAQRARQRRLAEQMIQGQVNKRILDEALSHWTNRVISIKLRELEIEQQRDVGLQSLALKKWKCASARHAEELSLMESYQLVKREENIRRIFYRWSSLARTHRHRRITLQKKEDEIKLSLIMLAWDRWRDRFSDDKLRPIEYSVIIQTQKNLIFRAFGIWHSKTKSLPAIRFHATNAKTKYFEIWQRGMPRALRAKQAREIDRMATLSKFMAQWVECHRTKMALKAVARARYLRLPTAVPRQKGPVTHTATTTILNNLNIFPRRIVQDPADNSNTGLFKALLSQPPFKERTALTEYTRTKSPSEASLKHSPTKIREPSPTRSRTSLNGYRLPREISPTRTGKLSPASSELGRGRLWQELREVQKKSQTSSQYSK
ncbi:hypothetical protein BDZ94DRAFT_1273913 [Collybia nuda]|uniref:Sfi1 spindle body domain-containing protein n=1 Tax=Collybia nuda TaxID=64659 RepID=A0A9P5XSZ8_9AGAR|nr:hypothetical protein BDZ94DRAFT_1273913 [Collybia nuda]